MRSILALSLLMALGISTALAQQVVAEFHSAVPVRAPYINRLIVQPDGKILVGGDIHYHTDTPVGPLIRITPDGELDETFTFSYEGDYYVHDLELRANGEIVVLLRRFYSYRINSIFTGARLLVLNTDGSIIHDIDPGETANTIAVQNDGKILISVGEANTEAEDDNFLYRYNTDMSYDAVFNAAVSFNNDVIDIQVVGDKIYCSGMFSKVNNVTKNDIVKLNLDGSIDDTFDTGTGTTDYVGAITIDENGKVLTGNAYINSFNGVNRRGNIRLNANGSVDESFDIYSANGGYGRAFLIGGSIYTSAFLQLDETGYYVFKLNQDGTRDTSFTPIALDTDPMHTEIVLSGDKLMFNGPPLEGNVYGLSVCNTQGELDETFMPRISRLGIIRFGDQQNEQLIVSGDFVRIDDLNTFGIARLNADGTVDNTFQAKEKSHPVVQMKLLEDETVLVSTGDEFFKLDSSGDRMPSFFWSRPSFDLLWQIMKFEVLPNGQIMAGDANTLGRLNSDGSVDESFYIGHTSNSTSFSFDMQGDSIVYGRTLYNDGLEKFEGLVSRITPDGVFDETFDAGAGPAVEGENNWPSIGMVKVLDNGEILIGGYFQTFDGENVSRGLAKLSKDGKFDKTFSANQQTAWGPNWFFDPQVEQIGDKIYIQVDDALYVINVDGTLADFQVSFSINGLNDIVPIVAEDPGNGRKQSEDNFIVALGSFAGLDNGGPKTIVKINVGAAPVPTDPEDPDVTLGLEDALKPGLEIYPQPTSKFLNIKLNNSSAFKASVYSLSGQVMLEQNFSAQVHGETNTIDVGHVTPGMYVLKVVSSDGRTGTVKFLRNP